MCGCSGHPTPPAAARRAYSRRATAPKDSSSSASDAAKAARSAAAASCHSTCGCTWGRLSRAVELSRRRRTGCTEEGDRADQYSAATDDAAGADGEDDENAAVDHRATGGGAQRARDGGKTAGRNRGHALARPLLRFARFSAAPRLLDDLRDLDRHFAYPDLELL